MMDMWGGELLERKAASHDGDFGGAQRIENRFFEGGGPDIGSEGLAINGDIDAAGLLVDGDSDAVGRMRACGGECHEKRGYRDEDERCTGNRNAHGQPWPPMME